MHRLRIILVVTCFFVAVHACFAGGRKTAKATPAPPPLPTITAVGPANVTINDTSGGRTIAVTAFTEIIVNGQRASISDLKPGMSVNMTLGSASEARRISASTTPSGH